MFCNKTYDTENKSNIGKISYVYKCNFYKQYNLNTLSSSKRFSKVINTLFS